MNTLHTIFDWLIATSLRASLLTIAVFLLQAALRRHLTARMRYALWLPVLIVLLMPVFPQSPWSAETLFAEPPPTQQVQITPAAIDFSPSTIPVDHSPPLPQPEPIDWQRIFIMAWLIGALGILLFGSISFLVTLRRFKHSRHPVSNELTTTLAQIAREVRLRRVPRVWIASTIHSPAVTGFLRPTLLLPAQFDRSFTPAEARLVLKHELMHLKRHDLPLNAVLCVLMSLHWFNPLLWLAFFKARLDREVACDAQVLQNDSADLRREYGHALLKVETAFLPRGLSLGFVGIFQRGAALRSRIHSIATHKRPHALMRAIFIICVTGMTFLGITRAQQPPSPKEDAPLIAIEIKIIEFKQATDWDFGGRLPSAEDSPFNTSLLSPAELNELLRTEIRKDGVNITTYPRMVTLSDKEVLIKSVVNHPYKGKDGQIAHLPICLVLKLKPTLRDQTINLGIDLTDSELIDPATGTAIAEIKVDHPTARSRIYKTLHETRDGQSSVIAGWDDGKPQSKRPLLYVITPHVIKPGEGGLPAGISLVEDTSKTNAFTIGNSAFNPGDSIQIISVERSKELLSVTADYTLTSQEKANLSLYVTGNQKGPPFDRRQATVVTKGKGRVTLHHPSPPPGQPHLSWYDLATHQAFGGIYFGTPEEAAQSRKYRIDYMTTGSPAAGTANSPTQANFPSTPNQLSKVAIIADHVLHDAKSGVSRFQGNARTTLFAGTPGEIKITAGEMTGYRNSDVLVLKAPFELVSGKKRFTSQEATTEAQINLKTGALKTKGKHKTEILDSKPKIDPKPKGEQKSPGSAKTKAAELRRAKPRDYDFNKAILSDVIRFLGTDAGIRFISLPDDHPASQRLITFSIRSSPFEVLETICRANGLVLRLDQDVWHAQASDDSALAEKNYALPKTSASTESILTDIRALLKTPNSKSEGPSSETKSDVKFIPAQNSVHITATRLQHMWVDGYFKRLGGKR